MQVACKEQRVPGTPFRCRGMFGNDCRLQVQRSSKQLPWHVLRGILFAATYRCHAPTESMQQCPSTGVGELLEVASIRCLCKCLHFPACPQPSHANMYHRSSFV